MPVFKGSRYENVSATVIQQNGKKKTFLHPRQFITQDDLNNDFTIQTVLEGEELDSIAFNNGGLPTKWWVIADVNNIQFAFDDFTGKSLVVPGTMFLR